MRELEWPQRMAALPRIVYPHDDALVITGDITDFDNGSTANILTWDALLILKAPLEKLRPVTTPLQGFGGATISMAESDQEKTPFINDFGTYCYTAIPFGLKNAGATYQRIVNKVFGGLIKNVIEAYVDDMVVKSAESKDHVTDLHKVFNVSRQNKLKLNLEKCVFVAAWGKFLGFMITQRGIKANPDKIKAILEMKSPISRKDAQSLTGRISALNRL
ncbi:Integrase catalytic domain-containing protein [Abeliophyllum distichum]|uniref:Integrase catalytic domain-containing protein n=1 Tax=Abeliophyllum distichum TaxID=126358 RepID=A0ABD1RE61_9LAMI